MAVSYVNNIASEHSEPQSDIANSSKPLLQGLKFEESMFHKSELPKPNQTNRKVYKTWLPSIHRFNREVKWHLHAYSVDYGNTQKILIQDDVFPSKIINLKTQIQVMTEKSP